MPGIQESNQSPENQFWSPRDHDVFLQKAGRGWTVALSGSTWPISLETGADPTPSNRSSLSRYQPTLDRLERPNDEVVSSTMLFLPLSASRKIPSRPRGGIVRARHKKSAIKQFSYCKRCFHIRRVGPMGNLHKTGKLSWPRKLK